MSLKSEQKICIACGFCCDGTLYYNAVLKPSEKGSLPEGIEQRYFRNVSEEFFSLPCPYFNQKCTIYDQKKAFVCSAYRCQLLNDHADNKTSQITGLGIVQRAKIMREDIFNFYRSVSGDDRSLYFKEVLRELGKALKQLPEGRSLSADYERVFAQCNIFEALLIKHFRSAKDFENMVAPDEEKE